MRTKKRKKKKLDWNAISTIISILALIATVWISGVQIKKSRELLEIEIENSNEAEIEQRIIDSVKFSKQFELTNTQFEKRRIFDSINFANQLQFQKNNFLRQSSFDSLKFAIQTKQTSNLFRDQRRFDSLEIERQFDTLYSHFYKSVDLNLKQLSLTKESIYFEDRQKKKNTLESLLQDLRWKNEILSSCLNNLENITDFGDDGGWESGQQGQILWRRKVLGESTERNFLLENQLQIDYALKADTNLLNRIHLFYKNLFVISKKVNSVQIGALFRKNVGYSESKSELLKLKPLYRNLTDQLIPEIKNHIYNEL